MGWFPVTGTPSYLEDVLHHRLAIMFLGGRVSRRRRALVGWAATLGAGAQEGGGTLEAVLGGGTVNEIL